MFGKLSNDNQGIQYIPQKISVTHNGRLVEFSEISLGSMHSLALSTNGLVFSCGLNIYSGFPLKSK